MGDSARAFSVSQVATGLAGLVTLVFVAFVIGQCSVQRTEQRTAAAREASVYRAPLPTPRPPSDAPADADWAAALAAAGGNLDALSEAQFDAMTEEEATPDERSARLMNGTGRDWREASEADRVLVLLTWQTDLDDLDRARGEFNTTEAMLNAATVEYVGGCIETTVDDGPAAALDADVRDIAAGCMALAAENALGGIEQ